MPHAVCWRESPSLIWTMVATNAVTFLSYLCICLTLLWMVRKTRRVIARDWAWFVVGFALFIVACGSTHMFEVITTWVPVFWMDATANIVTALLSAAVAIMLIRRAMLISWSINDYADRLSRTESEKQQMMESLLAARKLEDWSRLSASVSHEISNPVEAIQNMLYLIRSSQDASPEVVDLATMAADEADRVMTIARSMLTFFRQAAAPEPVDLLAAAESVRFVLQSAMIKKHMALQIAAAGVGDFAVEAFAGEARQVLLNLVRNAVEATTEGAGDVRLELTAASSGVRILITDKGAGIPADRMASLFEFGKTSKGDAGNGIGLWTVQHILTRHGGTIACTSQTGVGTRFTLWWPRTYVEPAG